MILALVIGGRVKEGCKAYIQSDGLLIAHAGGGLPNAKYANSREAIDLAVKHGFDLIELDFFEKDGNLLIWHEGYPVSDMSTSELGTWLKDHPDVRIITDIKTQVLSGLAHIKADAPGMEDRFIPEIHTPSQFSAVERMGFQDQILATYWYESDNVSWADEANNLPLFAIALPMNRRKQAALTHHDVLLHTVNKPMAGYGLYTDCLIPRSDGQDQRR